MKRSSFKSSLIALSVIAALAGCNSSNSSNEDTTPSEPKGQGKIMNIFHPMVD